MTRLDALQDGLAVAGFAAILYGIAQWSPPAAWVLGGLVACLPVILSRWRGP